jgi:DNA polymerase
MSLDLDTRQRAMLQEMGVHVWLPEPAQAPVVAETLAKPALPQASPAPAAALSAPPKPTTAAIEKIATQAIQAAPTATKPLKLLPVAHLAIAPAEPGNATLVAGIADMDWPTLSNALHQCQACKLCTDRRATVFEAANASLDASWRADWLVVGDPPDENEEREGTPFVDQAGQLLDNMLKAVGVARRNPAENPDEPRLPAHTAYVTQVVKCRSNPARNPTPQDLATCAHFLRREVALVQPKVIVAMGRFAAQTLLHGSLPEGSKTPFGKLRGTVYRFQGVPVVVTYHPSYLLRTPLDKARAWADLCLAMAVIRGST